MINVLGDALAAGIMAHLCKKDFEKAATEASATTTAANNGGGPNRVRGQFLFAEVDMHAHDLAVFDIKY